MMKGYTAEEARRRSEGARPPRPHRPPLAPTAYAATRDKVPHRAPPYPTIPHTRTMRDSLYAYYSYKVCFTGYAIQNMPCTYRLKLYLYL